jgi:thioesterase domain-containing protein
MPKEFDGRTILLWPEEDAPATPGNPAAEWQKISPNTTWRTIPGDHHSAVAMETHLREVAAQMRIALAELEA